MQCLLCRCGGIGCSAACCCGHHWPGTSWSSCSTSHRAWGCNSTTGAASAHRGSGSFGGSAGCRAPGCSAGELIAGVVCSDMLAGLLQSQQAAQVTLWHHAQQACCKQLQTLAVRGSLQLSMCLVPSKMSNFSVAGAALVTSSSRRCGHEHVCTAQCSPSCRCCW